MTRSPGDEIQRVVTSMDEEQNGQVQEIPWSIEQETQPEETIHIHYYPDAIVILKEEDKAQVVDSIPVIPQKTSYIPAYAICCFYFLLILSCIAFQVYCMFNPQITTVTIVPTSQKITMTGTMQLGRALQPLTISQSQTVSTTGKGHQSAKSATGIITFYNGQFQDVIIAAGTVLTGAAGVQIITDQNATIPAANPPIFGQVSVSAHAITQGAQGNVAAYDINQACCGASVLAKNTDPFSGGQDERDFQTVATSDISSVVTPLKTAVAQSLAGAFQGQVKLDEQLFLVPCHPVVVSDHQPGQEATTVKVTITQTCSAIAYNTQELETKATDYLTHQAVTKLETGYSLIETVQVSVTQATVQKQVILSFHAQGNWIYALSQQTQQRIKQLIAGKTKPEALQILASLQGVKQSAIRFDGFGDNTRLPKQSGFIHIALVVG